MATQNENTESNIDSISVERQKTMNKITQQKAFTSENNKNYKNDSYKMNNNNNNDNVNELCSEVNQQDSIEYNEDDSVKKTRCTPSKIVEPNKIENENSFSSSGNINIDFQDEDDDSIDSDKELKRNSKSIDVSNSKIVENTEIETDHLYMDDGAVIDENITTEKIAHFIEDYQNEERDKTETAYSSNARIDVPQNRNSQFFDDEDDDKNPIEHSGSGIFDKFGDYENDNVQSRDRYEKPSKHNKNNFSLLDGLSKAGKTHENDDFTRTFQSPKSDTKDAIKIISTPLGKVSIIYQSNTNNNGNVSNKADNRTKIFDNTNLNSMNKFKNYFISHNMNSGGKQNSDSNNTNTNRTNHRYNHQSQTSLSNLDDPHKNHPNHMNDKTKLLQKQITPVLTADGKVALLYRGAQDTINGQHKLETEKNLTDINQNIKSHDGKMSYDIVSETDSKITDDTFVNEKFPHNNNQTNKNNEKLAVIIAAETTTTTARTKLTTYTPIANTERPILKLFKSDESASRTNANEKDNSILPNINRPPSEVLGIKKNQFTQFRITDLIATATPTLANQNVTEKTSLQNTKSNEVSSIVDGIEHSTYNTNNGGDFSSNYDYDYYNRPNYVATPAVEMPSHDFDDSTTISDVLSKTEVVNLAIIPAFEGDLHRFHEQQLQQNDVSNDNNNNNPYFNMVDRFENNNELIQIKQHKHRHHHVKDLSALHCIMQGIVAIAAIATVFGMLGAYFKQRILDQLTIMHW